MPNKIHSFTDLETWKEGHRLAVMIYQATKEFPKEEVFGLTSQMRRCAVSITSNVAEGFSRQTSKEKIQFYSIARGSVTELQSQLMIAKDIGYMTEEQFDELAEISIKVHKLLNGLLKSTNSLNT